MWFQKSKEYVSVEKKSLTIMLFDGILSTCMIDSVSLKTHQSITNLMSVKVVIKKCSN